MFCALTFCIFSPRITGQNSAGNDITTPKPIHYIALAADFIAGVALFTLGVYFCAAQMSFLPRGILSIMMIAGFVEACFPVIVLGHAIVISICKRVSMANC